MSTTEARVRNRRGEGARLRSDIVAAAVEILETSGHADAVTLRAVARQVGISAPSIYGHFPDRDAILRAVMADGFAALRRALNEAVEGIDGTAERLRLGCGAYLRYAEEHPQVYRLMFSSGALIEGEDAQAVSAEGTAAFSVLVEGIQEAVDEQCSDAADVHLSAVATWVSLHGMSTLMLANPGFPWPDRDTLLDELVSRLTHLR